MNPQEINPPVATSVKCESITEDVATSGKRLINGIKCLLMVVVLTLLVLYISKNITEFKFILTLKFQYLLPACLLYLLSYPLAAYRFYMAIVSISHPIPFQEFFKYFIVGQFLPHGGNVYRAVMLKKMNNVSYEDFIAAMLSHKWYTQIFTLFFGCVIILIYNPKICIEKWPLLPALIILLIVHILLIIASQSLLSHFKPTGYPGRTGRYLLKAMGAATSTLKTFRNPVLFLKNAVTMLIHTIISILGLHLLFISIDAPSNIIALTVYFTVLTLSSAITITPSNLGVREFLLGFLSHAMGTGLAQGLTVSLISRLINLLIQGTLSMVALLSDYPKNSNNTKGPAI